MKKLLMTLLVLIVIFLSACNNQSNLQADPQTTNPPQLETTGPSSSSLPTQTGEQENISSSQQVNETQNTLPTVEQVQETVPLETDPPRNETQPTNSGSKPTEPTTTPTAPSNTSSEPEETQRPTDPPETDPPQPSTEVTEPPQEKIDPAVIEANANAYAVSLGFVVDKSLNEGNAGYYSPDYRPILSNEVATAAANDLVSATKNQLNSRFAEGYSATLVDSIFGLVRVNCVVKFSHTDQLGTWYYIYVFYG